MDIVQSAREPGQIKEPCTNCGAGAMHRVNDYQLCCECYIKAGHSPADWHPDCCKWHLKLHPPKKWKFRVGDSVMVIARPYHFMTKDSEAFITKCAGNGYEGYQVTFKDTGNSLAWVSPGDLTLIDETEEVH